MLKVFLMYVRPARAPKTVTLAFTGASGLPYGLRLLACLLAADVEVWLLCSQAARVVAQQECGLILPAQPDAMRAALCEYLRLPEDCKLRVFGRDEWFAPPASGSSPADAMVICPASMGTVAAVANGTADHLLERAADVCIKEGLPLIVVPRETPFSALHLENLLKLSRLGVCILPPAAGFYTQPQTIEDMVDFVVSRILDQLAIPNDLIPRWYENA